MSEDLPSQPSDRGVDPISYRQIVHMLVQQVIPVRRPAVRNSANHEFPFPQSISERRRMLVRISMGFRVGHVQTVRLSDVTGRIHRVADTAVRWREFD